MKLIDECCQIVDDCSILRYNNEDLQNIITPINIKKFDELLTEAKFDEAKKRFIVDGFTNGFRLQYTGDSDIKMQSPNLKFTIGDKRELWNKVMQEVKVGRYAGPFEKIPFKNYIQSPIGLVPKDGGKKTRLIFHLSYPRNTGKSVNENTDKNFRTVKYKDFDQAIKLCLKTGKKCYLGKSDFTAAFRHLPINPKDWYLLVMKAENPLDGKIYYFVDKCLPFGHTISCWLFQEISNAIEHILRFQSGNESVNYLDDFLFLAVYRSICNGSMKTFLKICEDIQMPVSMDKMFWATTQISFLGLLIDSVRQLICIPTEKVSKLVQLIQHTLTRKKVTLKQMQVLCGQLNFVCKSIVPGRAFTRRLYFSTSKVLKPHHHITLTRVLKADLRMWLEFLQQPTVYCRPFLDLTEVLTAREIKLYTDASRNSKLGCGGYCDRDWFVQKWETSFMKKHNPSIAFLELFAVVVAVKLWIHRFPNQRIILFCDNKSVVHMINKNTSNCPRCLNLVRILVLESMTKNVRIYAKHVDTKANRKADLLSRLRIDRFWSENSKHFNAESTRIPHQLWPMAKVWHH